jgi:hypothetical protein
VPAQSANEPMAASHSTATVARNSVADASVHRQDNDEMDAMTSASKTGVETMFPAISLVKVSASVPKRRATAASPMGKPCNHNASRPKRRRGGWTWSKTIQLFWHHCRRQMEPRLVLDRRKPDTAKALPTISQEERLRKVMQRKTQCVSLLGSKGREPRRSFQTRWRREGPPWYTHGQSRLHRKRNVR